ncbi:sensor histidine kinase [Paenibacillus sp. JCM 10914]|uniref:sensor histidine kinase n=1 Tax=Paenibacillus sp. JCM 10914 TaxID=1236974 RepID=UPI0003CC3AB2|nr:histidine kinase [Paenibacillus sp. JCM 10914]GAE07187.1 two-component sensor histidine kinase [Paenibacillus sp. JCM 10914]
MRLQRLSFGRLTINQRLFVLIILFIGLPFLLLGGYWYQSSTEAIEDFAVDTNRRIIEQTRLSLDTYISNLENTTYPFIHNPQIGQFLSPAPLSDYSYFKLNVKIEEDLFAPMMYGRSDIIGISLLGDNKRQINDFSITNEIVDMNAIRKRNFSYQSKRDQLRDFQILGMSEVANRPAITVARKLYDNSTFDYRGMLIVDLSLQQIGAICSNDSLGGFNVWIMGTNGRVVYHPDTPLIGTGVEESLLSRLQAQESSYFRHQESSAPEKIVLHELSALTGWTIVADLPLENLIGDLLMQRNISLAAAALLILIALVLVGGFSLSLTRPLSMLQKLMARVEQGDFVLPMNMHKFRNAEMSSVFQSFYEMTDKLKRLIKEVHTSQLKERELMIKQKESALRSMQSHINPHFLYNSLEIINSYAIKDNHMDISRITRALAHMFRYNISNADSVVPLREEMSHVSAYLELQSARFRKLAIDMDVEDIDLDRVRAIRLTLQPIVENVFVHGYRGKKPRYLGIRAYRTPDYTAIRIMDEGVGMTSETRHRIRTMLEMSVPLSDSSAQPEPDEYTSGIGLLNVHERLQLTFGTEYGLYLLDSEPDQGTTFEIRLPNHTMEEATVCTD